MAMTGVVTVRRIRVNWVAVAWLPLVVLPVATFWLTAAAPARVQLWALAISIFAGFKWLTIAVSPVARGARLSQAAGYLFLWTGMDADAFFDADRKPVAVRWSEVAWSIGQMMAGLYILLDLAPRLTASHPLIAGWLTMTGIVSILHFGLSHWLSIAWRTAGVDAHHIMDKPLLATSLADFWSRRWNLAFRDLMYRFVFQPLTPSVGAASASMAVFFVSGLIHDAVISTAARGGWGLPTLYFLIQGAALLIERSRLGRRVGLGRGVVGRLFAAAVIVSPAGLLFHPPFMTRVVLPMLEAIQRAMP